MLQRSMQQGMIDGLTMAQHGRQERGRKKEQQTLSGQESKGMLMNSAQMSPDVQPSHHDHW